MNDRANAQMRATGAIFDELRRKSPVTLEIQAKLDKAQALAESRIFARELSRTVHDAVKLDVERTGLGGIPFLGRLFRGGAGAGAGLPGILGKIPGGVGSLPPAAVIGATAAALAALPFLAQAAAGAITLTLGGGLAALGVAGALGTGRTVTPAAVTAAQDRLRAAQLRQIAAQDKLNQLMASGTTSAAKLASAQAAVASSSGSVLTAQGKLNQLLNAAQTPGQIAARKALTNLSNDAQSSLAQIGRSFQPVLLSIFSTADAILLRMTPVLAAAVKAIAGPVKLIGDTLLKSFASPQVTTAIRTLGTAFAALLKAFAPSIPGIVTSIADGFTNLFRAVARNPKAIAEMATGLFHLVGILLDVLAWLTQVANYVEHHWKPVFLGAVGPIIDHWHGLWSFLKDFGHWIWNDFILRLVRFFTSTLPTAFDIFKESVRVKFDQVLLAALRLVSGITGAFGHLPGPLGAPFRAAHKAIGGELARIQADVSNAVGNISADWARLNGQTSTLILNIATGAGLTGTVVPGAPHRAAAGTSFAAPGWTWVGERGPELLRMHGGEKVIPSDVARGYASGSGGRNPQLDEIAARLDEIADLLAQGNAIGAAAPARTGAGIGAALAMGGRSAVYAELYS